MVPKKWCEYRLNDDQKSEKSLLAALFMIFNMSISLGKNIGDTVVDEFHLIYMNFISFYRKSEG